MVDYYGVYDGDSSLIANVDFGDMSSFVGWVGDGDSIVRVLDGVGDAAFTSSYNVHADLTIAFRKGSRAVSITSAAGADGKRTLTDEQLLQLAKLVASRLP